MAMAMVIVVAVVATVTIEEWRLLELVLPLVLAVAHSCLLSQEFGALTKQARHVQEVWKMPMLH